MWAPRAPIALPAGRLYRGVKGLNMGYSSSLPIAAACSAADLAVLRHELANVLNGLSGMTDLLRSAGLGPEQERWLDAIEQSAKQMHFLVRSATGCDDDIRGEATAGQDKFNGISLLERTITAHTPVAEAKGLKLLLLVAPDLPVYWLGQQRLLRQLLDNLLGNAIKFTDTGQVLLEARRGEKRVLNLFVQDTGTGVPADERERIFKVRERGSNGLGRPGSGLGLSVCRRIVQSMHGSIRCVPATGGGTQFEVSLPETTVAACNRRLPSHALSSLSCVLHLDSPLAGMIDSFLERIGVTRREGGTEEAAASGTRLQVSISECKPQENMAWPGLVLRANGYPEISDPLLLRPPILESTLEQTLLRLALAWRWHRLSPGDRRG